MAEKVVKLANAQITGYEDDYILETISRTGDFYEKALLDAWTPLLGNPKVIMDVGANLGNHTVFWATTLPDVETIVSFEPYPANYAARPLSFRSIRKTMERPHCNTRTRTRPGRPCRSLRWIQPRKSWTLNGSILSKSIRRDLSFVSSGE